ncbi:xanthine dehydrogenase family protein subunit M [soil metagenome]
MKPAPFAYHKAQTLDHALQLLAEHGEDAKLLAGGQSLVALMNLRLAQPEVVIDIDGLSGLSYVLPTEGGLRIGTLTRHRQLERHPTVLEGFELLPHAARFVGHYPVRTRGTFGGSIAHADPAAEWVLLATLFDADIVIAGPSGVRSVPASSFFQGFLTTALQPDEMVVEVQFGQGVGRSAITEFSRRHGDFAVVSATVGFDLDTDGRVCAPRMALGGVASCAVRLVDAATALDGRRLTTDVADEVAAVAAAEIDDPPSDAHGDAAYRRHLTRTLLRRALLEAYDDRG